MYDAWREETSSRGNVTFKLGHQVVAVLSRTAKGGDGPVKIEYSVKGEEGTQTACFDELILAVDADTALKLLGKEATWKERQVLGSVKYLYDVTITHNDLDYMKKVRAPPSFFPLMCSYTTCYYIAL